MDIKWVYRSCQSALRPNVFWLLMLIIFYFLSLQVHASCSVSTLNELWVVTKNKKHKFKVEIAKTTREQQTGLMFRRNLAADQGMLFVKRNFSSIRMWMKNTYIPLDIIFIGNQGKIVDIFERAVPHSDQIIQSKFMAIAVLEVNGGTVSRLNINIGDMVIYSGVKIK